METTLETHEIASAWIGCLGCHDGGSSGRWYTDEDASEIPDRCARCGSDEFWVFDMESDYFKPEEMSPYEFVERVKFWRHVEEHADDIDVVRAYWVGESHSNMPDDPEEFVETANDRFMFVCDGYTDRDIGMAYGDWLEEATGLDSNSLPEPFRHHIDWESMGYDLRIESYVKEYDGSTYVFNYR